MRLMKWLSEMADKGLFLCAVLPLSTDPELVTKTMGLDGRILATDTAYHIVRPRKEARKGCYTSRRRW